LKSPSPVSFVEAPPLRHFSLVLRRRLTNIALACRDLDHEFSRWAEVSIWGAWSLLCPSVRFEPRLTFEASRPAFSLSLTLEPLDVLKFGAWAM
jgi:hypothetical protein